MQRELGGGTPSPSVPPKSSTSTVVLWDYLAIFVAGHLGQDFGEVTMGRSSENGLCGFHVFVRNKDPFDSKIVCVCSGCGPVGMRGVVGSLPCDLKPLVLPTTGESKGLAWFSLGVTSSSTIHSASKYQSPFSFSLCLFSILPG